MSKYCQKGELEISRIIDRLTRGKSTDPKKHSKKGQSAVPAAMRRKPRPMAEIARKNPGGSNAIEGGVDTNETVASGFHPPRGISKEEQLAVELAAAAGNGDLDRVKEMIEDGLVGPDAFFHGTPLIKACQAGQLEVVKYLVDKGANVHYKFDEGAPIFWSLKKPEIVEFLVNECGVDVNQQATLGHAPLMTACTYGNERVIRFLISKGAEVNAINNQGISACIMAADQNKLATLEILHEAGADVDAPTNVGVTPLMCAASRGFMPIVEFLVEKGADVEKRNTEGKTAADLARDVGNTDVEEFLLAQIAKSTREHGSDQLARSLAAAKLRQEMSREASDKSIKKRHLGNDYEAVASRDPDSYIDGSHMPPLENPPGHQQALSTDTVLRDSISDLEKTSKKNARYSNRAMSKRRRDKFMDNKDADDEEEYLSPLPKGNNDLGFDELYPAEPKTASGIQMQPASEPAQTPLVVNGADYGGYAVKGEKEYGGQYGGGNYGKRYGDPYGGGYGQNSYTQKYKKSSKQYADRTGKIQVVTNESGKTVGLVPVKAPTREEDKLTPSQASSKDYRGAQPEDLLPDRSMHPSRHSSSYGAKTRSSQPYTPTTNEQEVLSPIPYAPIADI